MPAPIYCIGSSSVCVCVWLGRPQIYHYVAYSGERRGGRLYIFFIFLVPKGAAHVKRIMETETAAEQAKPRVVQAGQECASELDRSVPNKEGRGHTTSFCPLGGSSHPPLLLLGSLACSRTVPLDVNETYFIKSGLHS